VKKTYQYDVRILKCVGRGMG